MRAATLPCGFAGGAPLKAISERLGHSTIAITGNIYSHVTAGLEAELASRPDQLFGDNLVGDGG